MRPNIQEQDSSALVDLRRRYIAAWAPLLAVVSSAVAMSLLSVLAFLADGF